MQRDQRSQLIRPHGPRGGQQRGKDVLGQAHDPTIRRQHGLCTREAFRPVSTSVNATDPPDWFEHPVGRARVFAVDLAEDQLFGVRCRITYETPAGFGWGSMYWLFESTQPL